jgi:hypothetical protein
MKIEFETEISKGSWDTWETHRVKVDGKTFMSQSEGIEPEDVLFYRDLTSPHDCEAIINAVIAATKRGEEIEMVYTEV